MSSTFNVTDIVADVAVLSNCPAFDVATRITLAQAQAWVGQSARSLSALLRQKFPTDRDFVQTASLSTVPGFGLVSLPDDCGEVHAVLWMRDAADAVLLTSAGAEDTVLQPLDAGASWDDGADGLDPSDPPRWRIEGQTIAIYPASGIAETIEVFYTGHLSPTSGTFQARLDFDRWVTLDVCIKVATAKKKVADITGFQQQKALLENDLFSRARRRDVAETHTIRDVRAERLGSIARRRWGG